MPQARFLALLRLSLRLWLLLLLPHPLVGPRAAAVALRCNPFVGLRQRLIDALPWALARLLAPLQFAFEALRPPACLASLASLNALGSDEVVAPGELKHEH